MDENLKVVGVLIDFDLATFPLPNGDDEPTSHHRSGTKPFMAIETLDSESREPYTHHFVHEMESILYTTVWQGVGYRGAELPLNNKGPDYLAKWRKGPWTDVRDSKKSFLNDSDTILSYIQDSTLHGFCLNLSTCINARYKAILEHKAWEKKALLRQVARDWKFDFNENQNQNSSPPIPPEPPIPSKAILPSFLKEMEWTTSIMTCSRDCCQDVPAAV